MGSRGRGGQEGAGGAVRAWGANSLESNLNMQCGLPILSETTFNVYSLHAEVKIYN